MLRAREEFVVGALERMVSVRCEELLQVVLDDHGRGVADLWHRQTGMTCTLCHLASI